MRNIRKIFVFLALVLIIGVLVSCTPSNLESIPDKTDTAAETSTAVDDETEDTDSIESTVTSTPQSSSDPVTSSSSSKSSSITSKKQTTMLYDDDASSNNSGHIIIEDSTVRRITCVEDLLTLANEVNGGNPYYGTTFFLEADIDLSGIEWIPIGTVESPFRGEFIGNNHTISNLTINYLSESMKSPYGSVALGLFGHVLNSAISGVHMENVSINISNANGATFVDIGGIVGSLDSQSRRFHISSCSVSGNISATTAKNGVLNCGGIIGCISFVEENVEFKLQQLQSTVNLIANNTDPCLGGIVGDFSINTDKVLSSSVVKDIIYKGKITNTEGVEFASNGGFCGLYHSKRELNIENVFVYVCMNDFPLNRYYGSYIDNGILIGDQTENCYGDLYLKNVYGSIIYDDKITYDGMVGDKEVEVYFENCLVTDRIPLNVSFDPTKWDLSDRTSPKLIF